MANKQAAGHEPRGRSSSSEGKRSAREKIAPAEIKQDGEEHERAKPDADGKKTCGF